MTMAAILHRRLLAVEHKSRLVMAPPQARLQGTYDMHNK
jgi:hypothetical protein